MSHQNYNRIPGPGDLPGDSTNPNSPDYVEPVYSLEDAHCDVANKLVEADEVEELVSDVHGALDVLGWACAQVDVPRYLQPSLRALERKAAMLDRMVDEQIEVMS